MSASALDVHLELPQKLQPLLEPHRYKVVYGGRGGTKSWSIARTLLFLGTTRRLRILCARQIQRSIRDSVHRLLSDQIRLLGLEDVYAVTDAEIRSQTGTEFIFCGLQDHTAASIKSYEGVDIVWCEEAQTITDRSWSILIPTIRKDGSEIWLSFNPELDTDATWERFVLSPPPGAVVIHMTWRDNPWWNGILEAERLHCAVSQPDDYRHIWEGECRTTIAGAIFAREVEALIRESRLTRCPYDPRLKVHTVWDLGWNDAMAILLVQRSLSECRILAYLEGSFQRVDQWAAKLNARQLNWGWDWLPHDGYSQERKSGQSDAAILSACGRRVRPRGQSVPRVDPEFRIRQTRQLLARTYLHQDGEGIPRLLECLKRYRRSIPRSTGEPSVPVHDEYSHGADAVGYLALVVDQLTNEDESRTASVTVPPWRPVDGGLGALG